MTICYALGNLIIQLMSSNDLKQMRKVTDEKNSLILDAGYSKLLHTITLDDKK